jgi:hypothetical protein
MSIKIETLVSEDADKKPSVQDLDNFTPSFTGFNQPQSLIPNDVRMLPDHGHANIAVAQQVHPAGPFAPIAPQPGNGAGSSNVSPQNLSPERHTPRKRSPIPIPRLSTTDCTAGPMSKSVDVPKRPKPGRKPMAPEQSEDRRRVQNRKAQRNFRDKRQVKMAALEAEIAHLKSNMQADWGDILSVNYKLEEHIKKQHEFMLQQDAERMRDHVEKMRDHAEINRLRALLDQSPLPPPAPRHPNGLGPRPSLPQLNTRIRYDSNAIMTSDDSVNHARSAKGACNGNGEYSSGEAQDANEDHGLRETDFTNMHARPKYVAGASSSSESLTLSNPDNDGEHCHFCYNPNDPEHCPCKMHAQDAAKRASQSGAGNCADCRADPDRAQACRDLAAAAARFGAGTPSGMVEHTPMSCGEVVTSVLTSNIHPASLAKNYPNRFDATMKEGGGYDFLARSEVASALMDLRRSIPASPGMSGLQLT